MPAGYVYILTNKRDGTLYTGVTSDLTKRISEHRQGAVPGFTKKYNLKRLVYFEQVDRIEDAILREKKIKKWQRQWKVNLIEGLNSEWLDLWETITM